MIREENVIVLDIDGTLCTTKEESQSYSDVKPDKAVVRKLLEYREKGFYIILFTSRQMRTYNGNIGKINANTAKVLFKWLEDNKIPHDEVHFAKPWCGHNGFYVDDKAIRPNEFVEKTYNEILQLLK
ncbi:HAD-IIIC family phosphatase [Sphingobacterium faecium]|uniref:HAD-IIIC family phosphatase n=1 Tax=Sphingobacterium faecium TaxID=34087 RepID=UPI0032091A0E